MSSKRPTQKLGFFKNYVNHLDFVTNDVWIKLGLEENSPTIKDTFPIMKESLVRSNMFTAFYDRYDITDDILKATVVPMAMTVLAGMSAAKAILQAGYGMAIKAGLARNDGQHHGDKAASYFVAALALHALSYVYALKALLDIVTRTFCTIADGFKAPERDRFSDSCTDGEGLINTLTKGIAE